MGVYLSIIMNFNNNGDRLLVYAKLISNSNIPQNNTGASKTDESDVSSRMADRDRYVSSPL